MRCWPFESKSFEDSDNLTKRKRCFTPIFHRLIHKGSRVAHIFISNLGELIPHIHERLLLCKSRVYVADVMRLDRV